MLKTTPHFWNLNEDSQLSRKVIHFIKAGNFQGYFWMPVMFSHRACLELCLPLLSGLLQFLREQAMAQWWEHSPPTSVAGFTSLRRRHMWVEFVVGSLLCSERFFCGYSSFPSLQKPIFTNSNSTRNQVDEEPRCVLPPNHCLSFICYLCNVYTYV